MPSYTFTTLSDYDFEGLARDLLQKELGLTLESFGKGRDKGIDLRYSRARRKHMIVQCKHYVGSGFSSLKAELKREVDKIERLNPDEYYVVTSVPMTPGRKEELLDILQPWCKSSRHIFGQEDLNNLLGRFKEVETAHFKLWLTSTPVLERVLHASILNESQSEVEYIRRRISRYVHNSSFSRAMSALEEVHYCIITGIPGIGKTTLAEMLLASYIKQDYEVIRIWDGISEARAVFAPTRKQVFYFDDFLGKTGLEQKLGKNEDERLLRFIADVSRSKHTRFILTTREYILNQATFVYEALKEARFDGGKCLIDLRDYTPFLRAKILYNHLFFSDLPREFVSKFAEEGVYSKILGHRNFSPRIIDRMTELINVRELTPDQYVAEFTANLDNPSRIWEFAFHNHLSDAARSLLLCLTTLPHTVFLDDLKNTFDSFQSLRSQRYNFRRTPYDFDRAVKELEGTFVTVRKDSGPELLVEFQNPSVRDFLERHLRSSTVDLDDLIHGVVFPDQTFYLSRRGGTGDHRRVVSLLEAFCRTYDQRAARLQRYTFSGGRGSYYWRHASLPKEQLFRGAVQLWVTAKPSDGVGFMDTLTAKLLAHVEGENSRLAYETLVDILDDDAKGHLPRTAHAKLLKGTVLKCLVDPRDGWWFVSIEHIKGVASLLEKFPQYVDEPTRSQVERGFLEFVESELADIKNEDEAHDMVDRLEDLESVAVRFGFETLPGADEVRELADRIPETPEPDEDDSGYEEWRETQRNAERERAEIRSMFESLADKKNS